MKMFPIQSQRGVAPHPLLIPWNIAESAYSVYAANYGRGQSLECLAERGGFGPMEMDFLLPGWRDMVALQSQMLHALKRARAVMKTAGENDIEEWNDVLANVERAIAAAE